MSSSLMGAVLESWDRQAEVVRRIALCIDDVNKHDRPSADGEPVYAHLGHIHQVRKFHMDQFDEARANALPTLGAGEWEGFTEDLTEIRTALDESSGAVRAVLQEALESGEAASGGYDHPMFFLQHLVSHEGWHLGLIVLALRRGDHEMPHQWQEANIWGQWRTD